MKNRIFTKHVPIIDSHIHLFNLVEGEYHWLKKENPPFWPDKGTINQNFTENDLSLTAPLSLKGFVHIEAGFDNHQPWREIAWLEANCHLPFRSVATIDLTLNEDDFTSQISKLLQYTSVVGGRHILDDEAAEILSQSTVQKNLAYMAKQHLSFDAQLSLTNAKAVDALVNILKSTPELKVIINHAGWPPTIAETTNQLTNEHHPWSTWLSSISTLSDFAQCAIKCSGWEMADRHYSAIWQQRIIALCLNEFGENRVMLASNFPLVLFSQSYQEFWQSTLLTESHLSPSQLSALSHDNAEKWYRL